MRASSNAKTALGSGNEKSEKRQGQNLRVPEPLGSGRVSRSAGGVVSCGWLGWLSPALASSSSSDGAAATSPPAAQPTKRRASVMRRPAQGLIGVGSNMQPHRPSAGNITKREMISVHQRWQFSQRMHDQQGKQTAHAAQPGGTT